MCYHVCATWVPQIIGAVPGIQHGESRVTTDGKYLPNVAMSIMLMKLKSLFSIDSFLLRFIAEYLSGRKQSVVVRGGVLHPVNYQSYQESPKVIYKVQLFLYYS